MWEKAGDSSKTSRRLEGLPKAVVVKQGADEREYGADAMTPNAERASKAHFSMMNSSPKERSFKSLVYDLRKRSIGFTLEGNTQMPITMWQRNIKQITAWNSEY